ncbi:MAG TPA: serine protease [Allocoleopsis sp.]
MRFNSPQNSQQLYNNLPKNRFLSSEQLIEKFAQEITVRILTNYGGGSGVIIGKKGNIYTVLTNDHVLSQNDNNEYIILTADGKKYQGKWIKNINFQDLDLALLEFNSAVNYPVVKRGNYQELKRGDRVLSTGFPNYYYWAESNYLESSYTWGIKAFRLTRGEIGMLAEKSLPRGYNLGYTNDVYAGMSGGPVLNEKGELIGINGRLKYPIQGIKAYIFADGTKPSKQMFREMESLSWGISVETFDLIIFDYLSHE